MAQRKSGLTREQHNAAAALMRRFYDWRDHTYCTYDLEDVPLDADTCEPIDWLVVNDRRQQVNRKEIGCEDGPFSLTTQP